MKVEDRQLQEAEELKNEMLNYFENLFEEGWMGDTKAERGEVQEDHLGGEEDVNFIR